MASRNNIKGITIEIGGETTKLEKALKKVNKNVLDTQTELKEVEKLLKLDPKNTELLAQKQELLKKAIGETKEKLDVLKTAEAQVQEQFKRGEVSEEQYRALQREIAATEQSLQRLEQEAQQSNLTLQKVGDAFGKVGETATAIGNKLMPVTAGLTAIGTASVAAASSFEDAMAKVSTIADTTEVPIEELEAAILNLSNETGIAATDIADNVYNAISAGQNTGDAVEFVSNATMLAKAGFAESADALDILTTIMNAYGLEAEEVTNVSDKLIQTQNLGKTTVAELSSAMGKVIPTAKAQGVKLDSLCGVYAVMTSNGIATAETTTYLNSMLNELGKQGSTAAKAFAEGTKHIKKGGLTMAEAMEQGWSLTDVLSVLDEQAVISGTSISNMFSSAEAGKAANVLWDNAEKLNSAIEEMGNSAGATETAFEKLDTTSNKAKKALTQIKNTGIELGQTILTSLQPTIEKVTTKIQKFAKWFSNLSDKQKQTIVIIAAVVAAIGPALIIFGKLSTGISNVIGVVTKLKGALGAGGGLAKALTMLTGPVGIVIAIIAALAAGFVMLYKNNDEFREKVNNTMTKVKKAFSDMWTRIQPILQQAKESFLNLLNALKPVFEYWITYISALANGIMSAAEPVIAAVKNIIDFVTNIIQAFIALFSGDFSGFLAHIKAAVQNVIDYIKNITTAWVNFIVGFFEGFGVDIKQTFSNIWNGIVSIFQGVGQWFKDRFMEAYTNVTNAFAAIGSWFSQRWQDIKNALAAIPQWFGTQFQNAWIKIKNAFSNVTSFFSDLWTKIKNSFTDIGVKIGSAVGDAFKSAINSCLSTIEGVVNKFIGMINGVIGIINGIPGVSLGKISELSLPRLAKGGILKSGQAMVAEAGPELLSMVNGKAVVTPLTNGAKNRVADELGGNDGGFHQEINITSTQPLSAYEVGRQVRTQTRNIVRKLKPGRV
ncbi:MAG: phage tail tape measure protein [Acetatifactor sp.]|nr:phage tail tape measure protein [Acetatifactor sp.]